MSLLYLVVLLVVVGVALWAINSYIPMDAKVKTILNVVVIVSLVVWLLKVFGVIGALSHVAVPTV